MSNAWIYFYYIFHCHTKLKSSCVISLNFEFYYIIMKYLFQCDFEILICNNFWNKPLSVFVLCYFLWPLKLFGTRRIWPSEVYYENSIKLIMSTKSIIFLKLKRTINTIPHLWDLAKQFFVNFVYTYLQIFLQVFDCYVI